MTGHTAARVVAHSVVIPAGVSLPGDLTIPTDARGIVVFAHGSGSSRLSPRNQAVARFLQANGFATLLFDLLTADEERLDRITGELRFDIPMLAERLVRVTDWLATEQETRWLRAGYFGASTGAGAALIAAARRPAAVHAVVSRGGRPDLAGLALARVVAPTLLIVGQNDQPVIAMNESALAELGARTKRLEIVPGATHLFEEAGAMERVRDLALAWFDAHLAPRA
jgi:pimeloyl-ACP methyl ester carboxylesterase